MPAQLLWNLIYVEEEPGLYDESDSRIEVYSSDHGRRIQYNLSKDDLRSLVVEINYLQHIR